MPHYRLYEEKGEGDAFEQGSARALDQAIEEVVSTFTVAISELNRFRQVLNNKITTEQTGSGREQASRSAVTQLEESVAALQSVAEGNEPSKSLDHTVAIAVLRTAILRAGFKADVFERFLLRKHYRAAVKVLKYE